MCFLPCYGKIAEHYAPQAGVNMEQLKNGNFSVGAVLDITYEAGIPSVKAASYNEGVYSPDLMTIDPNKKTVNLLIYNGKITSSLLNNKNNMISALGHEGGKNGHINNHNSTETKDHIEVYNAQINNPNFKNTTLKFQEHIFSNLKDLIKSKN